MAGAGRPVTAKRIAQPTMSSIITTNVVGEATRLGRSGCAGLIRVSRGAHLVAARRPPRRTTAAAANATVLTVAQSSPVHRTPPAIPVAALQNYGDVVGSRRSSGTPVDLKE